MLTVLTFFQKVCMENAQMLLGVFKVFKMQTATIAAKHSPIESVIEYRVTSDMVFVDSFNCKPFLALRTGEADEAWLVNLLMIFKSSRSVKHFFTRAALLTYSVSFFIPPLPVVMAVLSCIWIGFQELADYLGILFPIITCHFLVLFLPWFCQEKSVRVLFLLVLLHDVLAVFTEKGAEVTLKAILHQPSVMLPVVSLQLIRKTK